ncbi:hypothetical protein GCM10022247_36250 [Allokutzneria multivorans]|uniref:Peptidase U49-like protein n=1 Tax=Allokutzneria multivorans TaxID=1142134 RepID=A0ABP7SEU6_9PSEU
MSSPHDNAERFFAQLRALTTVRSPRLDESARDALFDHVTRMIYSADVLDDPRARALIAEEFRAVELDWDSVMTRTLKRLQDQIERTAIARVDGVDLGARRPVIGHLHTGQLNATSMRVPGDAGGYLVLFEDQMTLFASLISDAVGSVIPSGRMDAGGLFTYRLDRSELADRALADTSMIANFMSIIATYAAEGRFNSIKATALTSNVGLMLQLSLMTFVIAHEYAHVIHGHLDAPATPKGVLHGTDAETLAYSWRQEIQADHTGMILAVHAGIEHAKRDIASSFLGICLFFDVLDLMDRAVSLLETGDEEARKLGSHPPPHVRKELLRGQMSRTFGTARGVPERVAIALESANVQSALINAMWEPTRGFLLDLRSQGVRPARMWRTVPKNG